MSDITLYSWPTPNGVKASITLEELGIPYKTEGINISTNAQKEEYDPSQDAIKVPNTNAQQLVFEDQP